MLKRGSNLFGKSRRLQSASAWAPYCFLLINEYFLASMDSVYREV